LAAHHTSFPGPLAPPDLGLTNPGQPPSRPVTSSNLADEPSRRAGEPQAAEAVMRHPRRTAPRGGPRRHPRGRACSTSAPDATLAPVPPRNGERPALHGLVIAG